MVNPRREEIVTPHRQELAHPLLKPLEDRLDLIKELDALQAYNKNVVIIHLVTQTWDRSAKRKTVKPFVWLVPTHLGN